MRRKPTWIAECHAVIVHPDGHRVVGRIAVGQPYVLGDGDPAANYESHCPILIDSIYSPEHPIIGSGTLQALLLGVRMLGTLLHAFVARGGRVLDPEDDSDLDLESIFGPLLRDLGGVAAD